MGENAKRGWLDRLPTRRRARRARTLDRRRHREERRRALERAGTVGGAADVGPGGS